MVIVRSLYYAVITLDVLKLLFNALACISHDKVFCLKFQNCIWEEEKTSLKDGVQSYKTAERSEKECQAQWNFWGFVSFT